MNDYIEAVHSEGYMYYTVCSYLVRALFLKNEAIIWVIIEGVYSERQYWTCMR
jgi:hypothetical protein